MGTNGGDPNTTDMDKSDGTCTTKTESLALEPPEDSDGIIPRAVYDLFAHRQAMPQGPERVTIEMSYLEIYHEDVRDLLIEGDAVVPLQIRDSKTEGVVVQNLTSVKVSSPMDVQHLMNQASTRRATGSTAMNAVSSRSHAICTLHVTIAPFPTIATESDNDDEEATALVTAKLTLVDLAGSERIKKTGAEGQRRDEGISINKGLLTLGQCVSGLADMAQKGTQSHIPYRDSKLTRLLQDSLGGNSRTVMVACVSPADSNLEESVNTLRYATRTRNIKNSAVRNVVAKPMSAAEAMAMKRENEFLKAQLKLAQEQLASANKVLTQSTTLQSNAPATTIPIATSIIDEAVSKLDPIPLLQSTISSLESKLEALDAQQHSSADDALEASIRADKWQFRFEQVIAAAKEHSFTLPNFDDDSTSNESDIEKLDLVAQLRKEIALLKSDLHEALADAAVARSTAAAVFATNGDLSAAQVIDVSMLIDHETSLQLEMDKEAKLALTAELVAVSGGIEQKEAMAIQLNKERECMEAMQCHFEKAVNSLQSEADIMTAERAELIKKIGNSDGSGRGNSDDTKAMKTRIGELEAKIKDLRQKVAEHSKSIRLREAAEKRSAQLAKEIEVDKKRRIQLQRQLKSQAVEHRSEKMAAKQEAAKLLRDSNRLKAELQKVKDAAAKQAFVFHQKAAEAVARQKREAEMKARNQRFQHARKQNEIAIANSKKCNTGIPPTPTNLVDEERKEELSSWLDAVIAYEHFHSEIRQQEQLLSDANRRKIEVQKKQQFSRSSGNLVVDLPSHEIRAINEEIDTRGEILEHLNQSLQNWEKSLSPAMASKITLGSLPGNLCKSWLDHLSQPEAKTVFEQCFQRVVELRKELEYEEAEREQRTNLAVNAALAKERRIHDGAIVMLKMDHSQAIMDLLNSTKASIEQSVRLNSLNSVVDEDFQATVEKMLCGYLEGCNKASESVQGELNQVKRAQEGMKQMVESVAAEMFDMTSIVETASVETKKKLKPKNRTSTESIMDAIELLEQDDEDDDNDEDSEWSPSRHKTPGPKRRGRKSADSCDRAQTQTSAKCNEPTFHLDTTVETAMETVSEDIEQSSSSDDFKMEALVEPVAEQKAESEPVPDVGKNEGLVESLLQNQYENCKVKELKEMLRSRGLTVSGNKAELIGRLRNHDKEQDGSVGVATMSNQDIRNYLPSKEAAIPRSRRSDAAGVMIRATHGALQPKDINTVSNKSKKSKGKVVLPATPPQSAHKDGGWSCKKTASVRRSTMFKHNGPLSPLSSSSDVLKVNPVVDKENNSSKECGTGTVNGKKGRNLGSQFESVGNDGSILTLQREKNLMP
jgi:Kinesin motor domain/SAP domain